MKRIISLLVVMAMMLASVLAVIPVSATGSIDTSDSAAMNSGSSTEPEDKVEITRFVSEEAYNAFKTTFEEKTLTGIGTPNEGYVNGVTPFAFGKTEANAMFSNKRILSVYVPLQVLANANAEDEGKVKFTITVIKADEIDKATTPINTYAIKVDPATLTVGKMNKIDLSDYNIVLGDGETLVFGSSNDTLKPVWYTGSSNFVSQATTLAPHTMTIYGNAGKANADGPQGNHIFLDFDMVDATAGKPIYDADDFAAIANDGTYYLANDITLPEGWAAKAISGVTLNGNYKTITLSGANGLFGDVTNSTVKNFTLAGGTTTSGVANNANVATFKNITVNLAGVAKNDANVGGIVATAKGNVTIDNCINNAPISGSNSNVAGMIGKVEASCTIKVSNSKNTAAITGNNAAAVVGQAQGCGDTAKLEITGFENSGAMTGGTTSGLAVAYNCNGGFTEIVVTNTTNLGASGKNWAGGFIGAMHRSGATVKFESCVNGKEGDANVGAVTSNGTGAAGFIMEGYTATYTLNNCTNYATINGGGGQAGGALGKVGGAISVSNFLNTGNVNANNTAAGVMGWYTGGSSFVVNNATNLGTISASNWAGGLIGANYGPGTQLINCVNGKAGDPSKGVISGNCTKKGGFISESNNSVTIIGGAAYGSISGSGCAGGVIAYFTGTKLTVRNFVSDVAINVAGAWNNQHGGYVGKYTSNEAEFYFTDCINNTDLINSVNSNPGGFIGGGTIADKDERTAKKMAFLRCVNNGNISSPGCVGGFIGQNKAANVIFIDCVNTGDLTSTENVAGGFTTYSAGYTTMTFINCVNTGSITATKAGKWSSGFAASGATNTFVYNSANYGNVTTTSHAEGLIGNAKNLTIENSFNAGLLTANTTYTLSNCGNMIATNCIDGGNHKNILDRLALLSPATYETMVEQDKWDALKDVVAAAKAVYDNSESTNADKRAIIANLEAVLDDINTYVDSEAGANFNSPSLKINVSVADGKTGDYVALVKDGDTDATIKVLVKNITADFDILALDPEEGKAITAGTYKLYLLRGDVAVADAVADETLALAVKSGIIVDVNVIKTAEQFMAMTNGDYILGNDVAVAGGIENFTGKLDGMGYTVSVTGSNGVFKSVAGATVKNLKFAGGTLGVDLGYGLVHQATGNVKFENIELGVFSVRNSDRAGALINTIEDNNADIVIKDVTSLANVHGYWMGGGIIGRAYVKSATLTNVVNGSEGVATTVSNEGRDNNYGAAGIMCDVAGNITMNNVTNYATVTAGHGSVGGIMAQLRNQNNSFVGNNVVNYGNVSTTRGWPCGASGMIGAVEHSVNVKFTNSKNYGNATAPGNMGGFIGYTRNDKAILSAIFENCENNGNITTGSGNVGGFLGQISTNGSSVVTFTDCINRGNITTGASANKDGIWAGGFTATYTGTAVLLRCYNYGTITAHLEGRTNGDGGAAGLVAGQCKSITDSANYGTIVSKKAAGIIFYDNDGCTINNVANYGTINGISEAGGIAARLYGTCTLENVTNTANVTATAASEVGRAAGIVALAGGTITLTNATNGSADAIDGITISGAGGTWQDDNGSGGIFGYANGTIKLTNVTNYAKIAPTKAVASGGIIGLSGNGEAINITLTNVNNYGTVITSGYASEGSAGMIGNTKYSGTTVTFIECGNYGDVIGGNHTAGFVGWADNNGTFTFTDCVNDGTISTTSGDARYAAGFMARCKATANFTDCVNNGDILVATTNPDNAPNSIAAGFVANGMVATSFDGCTNNGYIQSSGVAAGFAGGVAATIENSTSAGVLVSETNAAYAFATNGGSTITNSNNIGSIIKPNDTTTYTQIWTAVDFMNMNQNGYYILMDNIVLPEDYQSIDLGLAGNKAVIEGNGKIIYMKGLTCPLFDTLGAAEISNLTIVGSISGDAAVAVIAKTATGNVTINNVVVDVDINCTSDATVGGFIANATAGLTITDSKFVGSIYANGYAGGFAGIANGNVTVSNSAVGFEALTTVINGTGRVGGLFGLLKSATATISKIYNFAAVNQTSTRGIAGGLIAQTQLTTITLDGAENYGNVDNKRTGIDDKGGSVTVEGTGGFIGDLSSNSYATILDSVNYADVVTAYNIAGGLIGTVTNSSKVTFGAIDGDGVVTDGSYNFGDVYNTWTGWTLGAGGIVGAVEKAGGDLATDAHNNEIRIYDTVNYGDVSTNNGNTGGMVGFTGDKGGVALIEVIGCANYGDISSTGNNRVGGILGQVLPTTIIVKNTNNYGYISSQTGLAKDSDTDAGTCHAAGIRPEHYAGNTTTEIVNCANYGTIYSKTSSAAGITVRVDATNSKIEGCVNYGTIIGGFTTAGVCAQPKGGQVKNCANFGLIVNNAGGAQVAPGADYTNVAAGAVISDPEIAKIAKTINAADYNLADLIGIENTAAGSVDPTDLTFSAYDDEGVVADFEYYYVLNVDDEAITSDATVEGDFAGHTAIQARSYAAKLARISSNTEYVLTFNAKTTGADAGFVYAISPAGTAKTYLTAIEEGMILDGDYAQFEVKYNGLIATISVLADGANGDEWVVLHEALLEDGAYAAIGIANGASETTGEGEDLVTFADSKQVASVADIAFSNTYRVGGIINAFSALDTLAINLSDASFDADALAAALADATAAETNALAEVEAARLAVEAATKALNDAVAAGQRESELDDEMATLEEAIARHDQAKRDEHLINMALQTVTANEAKAAAAYKAVSESYAEAYAEAVENIVDTIDGVINYGEFNDAFLAAIKLGVKFTAKFGADAVTEFNTAIEAGSRATTQAEVDAAAKAINDILDRVDWSEYNYWKNVMNSLNEVDYTIFSWATFAEFKATVAEKEATFETQEQIDMMTAEIIINIEALKDDIYQAAELQEYLDKAIAYREYWNAEEENENYTENSWADFYNTIIKPFQDAIDAVDPDLDNDGVLEYAYDGAQFNDLESELISKYEAFKAAYEKTDAENNIILVAEINYLYNTAKDAIEGTGEYEYSDITKLYLLAAIPEAEKIYAKIAEADAARDYAAAQKAVEDAIDVYAPVVNALADVTELKATIAEQADALAAADTEYTAETWNAYELALAKAEFTVVTAKSDEEVAEALAELIAAYDALVEFVAVDTDTLIGAIASAEALNKANYTASSWADLREAILEAKLAILADDQAVIDAAYAALADAIADLVLVPDTDALKALVGEASALNATEYTAETWLEFALALQNAKAALKSDTQKDVNDAKDALAAAKAALVKKAAADNSALKTLIAEVEALKEADYTADTWASLKTALEAAKAVLDSDKQTDIDVAKATLAAAKAGLDKVVVENEAEEAPKTEDNTQTTEEKKGCKSAIGATVVVMTAVLGLGATVVLKKKED